MMGRRFSPGQPTGTPIPPNCKLGLSTLGFRGGCHDSRRIMVFEWSGSLYSRILVAKSNICHTFLQRITIDCLWELLTQAAKIRIYESATRQFMSLRPAQGVQAEEAQKSSI